MRSYYILMGLLIIFSSCSSNKEKVIEKNSFPVVMPLHGVNIGPIDYFDRATRCIMDSNYLIVLDEGGDYCFHFLKIKKDVNHNNYKILGKIGRRGRGPNEIVSTPFFTQQSFFAEKKLFFYDAGLNKICKYNLEFSDNKVSLKKREIIDIPYKIINIQNIAKISNDTFVARGCLDKGKLVIFNKNKVNYIPFYPLVNINKKTYKRFYTKYYGDIAYNSIKKRIVCSNRYFNQVEIFSDKGKLLKEIRFDKLKNPFQEKDPYYYYNAISTTENFIYASYLGVTKNKLNKSLGKGIITHIHVFDWDGNFISMFILDRLTGYFCVNDNDNFLIAIDEMNSKQPLVFYGFNNKLKQ